MLKIDNNYKMFKLTIPLFLLLFAFSSCKSQHMVDKGETLTLKKEKDVIIYHDTTFYSAFPSVIRRQNGNYMVAFRRAPEKRMFGEKSTLHVDANSYLVSVESQDGINWTAKPKLLHAHPFGGSQDPCLLQLRNGHLICASYGWAFLRDNETSKLKMTKKAGATFLGGYILRSTDDGQTWSEPIYPPSVAEETRFSPLGQPLPAYNRGAMVEGANGTIYWAVVVGGRSGRASTHLLASNDEGLTWDYSGLVAEDSVASFNETSVYETPKGDLIAFMRTANFDDQACIARSTDGGKTFKWESMKFKGHPLHALRLPDNQVLLVYGYRHKPHGIRARILNAECTDFATAEEFVIRDDGGGYDLGYPWAVMMDDGKVLVSYYYNIQGGTRHIAGSILSLVKK